MDRCHLLSGPGFARSACLCDTTFGDYHADSGFSPQMGSPQANCTLDSPDLALRLSHRGVRVFNALQVVSPGNVMQTILPGGDANTIVCVTLKSCT